MGWRTAAGQMAAGTYDVPGDQEGAGFASGFAAAFVPALNDAVDGYVSEQREKRLLELKESLLRQRPRSTSTASADRKTQEELRDINALASSLGIGVSEATTLYYSYDGDVSMAVNAYSDNMATGLYVTPAPSYDEVPVEPAPVDEEMSAVMPEDAPVAETASLATPAPQADNLEATQGLMAESQTFDDANAFQVASLGSIADDLALKEDDTEDDMNQVAANIAANLETEVETAVQDGVLVADASGAVPAISYGDVVASGATPTETRRILAAGQRLPDYYKIPEPATITTLGEAQAAMDVLEARREYIGQDDGYYSGMKPLLEARIASLTELPDLGEFLQTNSRDQLVEFYENGWQTYEGKVDPAQLQAHRDRALTLLQQSNSMPEIPQDLAGLRNMKDRVAAGEFTYMPTEWYEQLNISTRRAELEERYDLSVDYIMDESRSDRELLGLRAAAVNALGEDDPVVRDIDIALGTRRDNPIVPDIASVTANNWRALEAKALQVGDEATAAIIRNLGTDIDAAEASNSPDLVQNLDKLSTVLSRAAQPIADVNTRANAYINAVQSAYQLNEIVQRNPNVNYFFGGQLPAAISGVVGEIGAIRDMLSTEEEINVDVTTTLSAIDAYERDFERRFVNGQISQAARDYAIYQAQEQRLAFQVARMQQGPAGVISNKDFESALQQVRASRDASNYEAALRGLVSADEVSVRASISDLNNNSQIMIARTQQEAMGKDYLQGATMSLEDRVAQAGIQEAYDWLHGGTATDTAPQIPEAALDYLRSNPTDEIKQAFEAKYGVSADGYLTGGQ